MPVRGRVVVVQVFGEAQSSDGTIIPAHAIVDDDRTDDS